MISSGSRLAEDIRYGLAYWVGLTHFLDDGRLELDTNPVENAIRPICLTRKNALFAGHEIGAEKLGAALIHRRHVQAQRRQPRRLPRRNHHGRRSSTKPDRRRHADSERRQPQVLKGIIKALTVGRLVGLD